MSENQEAVSHNEFETRLVRLPFQIFLLIAENDDKVDTNEWMAFIKILKEKKVCDSPYARGVLGKTEDKLQALKLGYERKEIKNDPEEIKKTLIMIENDSNQRNQQCLEQTWRNLLRVLPMHRVKNLFSDESPMPVMNKSVSCIR